MKWLEERFDELVASSEVPGASIAVAFGDQVVERAAGVLNLRTGVEATTDSVFQIGSITKVWTATLVMQLVDDGLLDLDAPVRTYLPDFRVADEHASTTITPRHCLSHTSGVEGDIFVEAGRGDDAIERFCAEILPGVPQLFPPGELYSYCNTGFTILGRVVEVLRGQSYNEVLLERLAKPLGLTTVSPRAENAILHRASVGHLRSDGEWEPAQKWAAGYAGMPAGAMLAMSASDLLGFARMHLGHGSQLLSEASLQAMREPQVQVPQTDEVDTHWGLGWSIEHWLGGTVIGHDGGTIGQTAYLRVAPEHNLAAVLLTNGGRPVKLFRAIFGRLFEELAGVEMPPPSAQPEQPERVDTSRYVGRYESRVTRFDIEADEHGDLWREIRLRGELAEMLQRSAPERDRIVRLSGDRFITVNGQPETFAFVGDDGDGRAAFLFSGRARPRVDR